MQKNIDQNSYLYHKCVIAATFYFNKHKLAQVICHFWIWTSFYTGDSKTL